MAAGAGPPLSGAGVRGALPLRAQAPSACTRRAQLLVRGLRRLFAAGHHSTCHARMQPHRPVTDLALYKHGSAELLAR